MSDSCDFMRNFGLAIRLMPWSMRALVTTSRFLEMPASPSQTDTDSDAVDVSLMRRIATGDEQAFRLLVERHQNSVIGTIAKMLHDPTEAEDLAQQSAPVLAYIAAETLAERTTMDPNAVGATDLDGTPIYVGVERLR